MMTLTSEKAPGYYTKTPNKPKGRAAKQMAFYALNRRKSLGRSVIKQIRAAMPPVALASKLGGLVVDYGDNFLSSVSVSDIESAHSLPPN